MLEPILAMLEGGQVRRFHIYPLIQHYDVSQHSWGMALLLFMLHPEPSKALIWATLSHDLHERYTGDVPWSAKAMCPELTKALSTLEERVERHLGIDTALSPEEHRWLRALDILELFLFCDREFHMGNLNMERPREKCLGLLNVREIPDEVTGFLEFYRWTRTPDLLEEV